MAITENQCIVDSTYLTPTEYSHAIQTELRLDVYNILNVGTSIRIAPTYFTTIFGYCSSCNITVDSSSNARLSVSINMIMDKSISDEFLIRPESFVWYNSVWKIIKTYKTYNVNDSTFDLHDVVFGYVFPNQNAFSYTAETRELSISGSDLITSLSGERGGTLLNYMTEDWKAGSSFWNSGGMTIEGNVHDTFNSFGYSNLLESLGGKIQSGEMTENEVAAMWKTDLQNLTYYNNINGILFPTQEETTGFNTLSSAYDWIRRLSQEWVTAFPLRYPYVNLRNANETFPHDMEFEASATLLDVYTEIINLYPNQTIYFDTLPRLCLEELPSCWLDNVQSCDYFGRDLYGMVLSENTSYDYNSLVNYVVVFGKDGSCCGKYMVRTGWQCHDINCTNHDTIYTAEQASCPICGGSMDYVGDENILSVDRVGYHKKVISSDMYSTDEECKNAAKAECLLGNRYSETVSLTLADTYYSFLNRSDLNVGRKIEYTSILTGETNIYTISKISNDFSSGTIAMDLNRFYPIRTSEDTVAFRTGSVMAIPSFTYTVSNTGLMTMTISSGTDTQYSLYKVYMEVDSHFQEAVGAVNKRNIFIGETCTTLDNNNTKTFTYQFKADGDYVIKCIAYNANFQPSDFSVAQTVSVNCFSNRYLRFDTDSILALGEDSRLIVS